MFNFLGIAASLPEVQQLLCLIRFTAQEEHGAASCEGISQAAAEARFPRLHNRPVHPRRRREDKQFLQQLRLLFVFDKLLCGEKKLQFLLTGGTCESARFESNSILRAAVNVSKLL